ncbi:unnamed protein product [Effrenium voratum]|nr:unnamed protein product [Effrenium voratum]
MAAAHEYSCSGSLWWMDFFWAASPVFVSQHAIDTLRKDIFAKPGPWPSHLPVIIACEADWTADQIKSRFGKHHVLLPEEIHAAIIASIADAIRSGAEPEVLKQWRDMTLSCHFVFTVSAGLQQQIADSISNREKRLDKMQFNWQDK